MCVCACVWIRVVWNAHISFCVWESAPFSKHGSLLMRDCTSICLVSSLWEYIMAKEHVCQWEDKLKQDVVAPHSFEGVPHHTSDSAEGRSTTIKGHSVYLNLPASACQMFQSFSFISSHEPYFLFLQRVCCSRFCTDEKEEKSTFFCWREERLNLNIVSFAFESLLRLKDLGWRGRQGSLVSPSACLYWWRHWYRRD